MPKTTAFSEMVVVVGYLTGYLIGYLTIGVGLLLELSSKQVLIFCIPFVIVVRMRENLKGPSERDYYLKHCWRKYPSFPSSAVVFGKIHDIDYANATISIGKLDLKGFKSELISSRSTMVDSPHEAGAVLLPGDSIAWTSGQRIVLLAPNLADHSFGYPVLEASKLFSTPRPVQDRLQNQILQRIELLQKWSEFLVLLRHFFLQNHFVEAQTPLLVECPGTEPSLEIFETNFIVGSKKKKFFLPTSPELHLKKLLCLGAQKLFEISTSFRNGEMTERHQPEFKILEFYEAYADLRSTKSLVIELVNVLCKHFEVQPPQRIVSFTVAELFKEFCDFDLHPSSSLEDFRDLANRLQVDVRSATSIDDYFFLIFMERIEYKWSLDELVFVEKYPPFQAALARLSDDGWAERFEFYWKGFEIGNAFHELNDPVLQKLRAEEDITKKRDLNRREIALDEEFFAALNLGMPPSAGIAIGLERLFMSLFDAKSINEVLLFPKVLDLMKFEK